MQHLCGVPPDKTEPPSVLASYPGLLNPAFVTCSTNTGEGLVKLMTCSDILRHWVDMWRSDIFPEYCKWVCYWTQPQTLQRLRDWHQAGQSGSLGDISWVQKAASQLYRTCHFSTCPPNIQVNNCMWSVLPHISTSSDKHWGEKAWIGGYICTRLATGLILILIFSIWCVPAY